VDWARSVAGKARELTGQEFQLWGTVYSRGVGTIWWTGRFESIEALESVGDVLGADPSMEKLTNAGTRYTEGGFDDGLLEPSYGTPATDHARYVTGATAIAAAGCYVRAIEAGVTIARRSEAITGRPTIFCRSVTGRAGEVTWLTGYESASAMEAAQRKLAGDQTWLELLDSTSGRFAPDGCMNTTIGRRFG
jgi:hypothetical protein